MTDNRLQDYLEHIFRAATDAGGFVEGLEKEDFLADKRTQQAVIMSIVIVGEAATRIMSAYPDFVAAHPEISWQGMRNMRNRVAHGYFEINLSLVWDTVRRSFPELLTQLAVIRG